MLSASYAKVLKPTGVSSWYRLRKPVTQMQCHRGVHVPIQDVSKKYMFNRNKLFFIGSTSSDLRRGFQSTSPGFFSLPSHTLVPMPALSPTMESGSIAAWNLKEGDSFEAGQSICEVATDKATVSLDATDDGFIAKILVEGDGEIKVGAPLMITVEEKDDISAFADYKHQDSAVNTPPVSVTSSSEAATPTSTPAPAPHIPSTSNNSDNRVFASPLARKLAREAGIDLSNAATASMASPSGPNGRYVAADILKIASMPNLPDTTTSVIPESSSKQLSVTQGDIYSDFELSDLSRAVANRLTACKSEVPHYYLSVELNLSKLLSLRADLNSGRSEDDQLSVIDFLIKSSALSMKAVPDANAAWMDTFVRRYDQVDINLVMGAGSYLCTPVIKDVGSLGVSSISASVRNFEELFFEPNDDSNVKENPALSVGTFSIHNLGMFGVKSAAPIVLAPQACALALGAITETVVPKLSAKEGEDNWEVAPVMTATLSCDHRVIDGAVGAQWLSAFKTHVENPMSMIL